MAWDFMVIALAFSCRLKLLTYFLTRSYEDAKGFVLAAVLFHYLNHNEHGEHNDFITYVDLGAMSLWALCAW